MNATVIIDDRLLAQAKALTGEDDRSVLLDEALRFFVEAKKRERTSDDGAVLDELMTLAGSEPDLVAPPRRRFE